MILGIAVTIYATYLLFCLVSDLPKIYDRWTVVLLCLLAAITGASAASTWGYDGPGKVIAVGDLRGERVVVIEYHGSIKIEKGDQEVGDSVWNWL